MIIPPFDRGECPTLANCFWPLQQQRGLDSIKMTSEVESVLMKYSWPGNVRELENVIEQASHLLEGSILKLRHLPSRISSQPAPGVNRPVFSIDTCSLDGHIRSLDEVERDAIFNALMLYEGNVSAAAEQLGVGRTTLYRKLDKYSIDLESLRKTSSRASVSL